MRTLEPELHAADSGWLAVEVEPGEVHTVPCGDIVLHEADDCVCGPTTVPILRPDGSIGYSVNHHSLLSMQVPSSHH